MAIEIITCPACRTRNASHRLFCRRCGARLAVPLGGKGPEKGTGKEFWGDLPITWQNILRWLGGLIILFLLVEVIASLKTEKEKPPEKSQDLPRKEAERGQSVKLLAGKWLDKFGTDIVEFHPDGTVLAIDAASRTVALRGKYRVIDGKAIEVEFSKAPRQQARKMRWELTFVGRDGLLITWPSDNPLGFEISQWKRIE